DGLTMGDIAGSFSGGVLTLTSASHAATAAEFQAALAAVKFYDTSDTPVTGSRTATIAVADATTSSTRTIATTTVTVVAANDSPVLTPNPSLTVGTAIENGAAPVGAVGTLVSSLVGGVADTDGAGAHDGAAPGLLGIAITQADTTEGTWYYSTDNGATWTEFAGTGMTAISDANALHLVADANTRIYFQGNAGTESSTIDTALTFHGWDRFDGAANGSLSALPTDSALGTGTNTQASAYSSAVQTVPLTITATGAATYVEPNDTAASGAAVAVNGDLILTSSDLFSGATVRITGNFQLGEDVLVGTTVGPFAVGAFDAATGTLTFTGTGTAAQLQAALRAVEFYDSSDTPNASPVRTITITAHDATTNSDRTLSTTTMTVEAANDSPVLTPNPSLTVGTATENGAAPVGAVGTLVSSLVGGVADTDGAGAHDGATPGLLGIAITQADTTGGTWYYSTDNGATWTAFAGTGMTAISDANALHLVADANTRIYFQGNAGTESSTIDTALTFHGWDRFDGAGNGSLSALPTDGALGTGTNTQASAYSSAVQTVPLTITATGAATYVEPNDTAASGAAVAVNGDLILTSGDLFSGATVRITGNFQPGEDVLVGTTVGPFTVGAFDASTGTLTFIGTGTVAQLQAALRGVTFYDSSDTPNASPVRTITITTHDATTNSDRTLSTTTVTVEATNDSPVLHGTTVSLNPVAEDAGAPVGAVGTLVSALTGNGNVTDTDGAGAHDGAVPGTLGIAITQADTTEGNWYYSTDNGAHWTEFAGTGMPAISGGNALHLVADANTRIYFAPNANWNGAIPDALTIRGWDRFDGAANGSLSALPSDGAFGTGTNTHASAYSAATQTLQLVADPVNDAPVASGSASLPATSEDTANPPGDTVAHLFGGNFNDSTDQQRTADNPTGSVANTLAGIAITGNAATAGEGTWQYSTDHGTTWTTIPTTGLGDGSALVLPASAELRFVPAANFNGVPGGLTTRLIDSSTELLTTGVTGQDLSTGTTAYAGVDVSGSHDGGTTAVSAATVTLDTSVTAVNDAPIASGSATLAPIAQNAQSNPGDTVADLFGGNFSDTADQQQSADNPTGSVANSLVGIAITGNAAAGQGTWEYSTDHGATWTAVPTSVSDGSAIIVPVTGSIRFVPNDTFHGIPGALTVHLIDSSSGSIAAAATGVNVTDVGGSTVYSAAPVLLSTQVIQSGGRAILTPPGTDPIFGDMANGDGAPTVEKPPTDDLGTSVAANHGSITDDFLERPIIPQISLIGSVGNRFILAEQQAIIAVPSNLFDDTYPGAQLQYEARDPAGGALPAWLQFDPRNLTFTGTPPASAHGAVDVLIVAKDQFGNEATASFRILVGREPEDLQHLLAPTTPPPSTDGLVVAVPAAPDGDGTPVTGNGAAPGRRTHAGAVPHDRHADAGHGHVQLDHVHGGTVDGLFASLAQPAHGGRTGHSAFSAQLREAGPIGRLSQARQLLDTIAKTVSPKPAA
ncbi:MAG TPA: putative Ig domain-containing protein, partial [Aliidongia sp.]|nr:putative Ig domain-containing protein [Aliidongia sp.]